MTSRLTVDGYTFDNPPGDYRKIIKLSNNPQTVFQRFTADFYQSDSQDVQVQVSGELSLNETTDLTELQTLQDKAINGGEVRIDFDPFFSGKGVITDTPFRQEDQRGQYDFTFAINEVDTDPSGYPDHATPTTGNTFELGGFDFGFDPDSVQQEYNRQTASVDTLQGLNRTVDNKGLVPRVTVSGRTDGAGGQALWDKARSNALSYLSAEFQNGWSLITRLQVGNDPDAPDFVTGLLQYSADFLIVKDPSGGIGQVSSFIDHDIRDTGSYTADSDAGDADSDTVTSQVDSGSTDLAGQTTTFGPETVTVQLSTTNYVYVSDPDNDGNGDVRVNQSAFPSNAAPLYEVETDGDGVTNVIDRRETDTSGGDDTLDSIGFTVDAGSDTDAGVSWSKTLLQLDPNATNYVEADGTTGDVTFNTTGFTSGDVALYEVQTDATSVDVVIDQRAGTTTGGDSTTDTVGFDVQGGTGAINGDYVEWTDTTVQLQLSATNYVYVVDPNDDGQGQVEVNQSAVPSDALGLWEVVTDDTGVTSKTDLRDSLIDDGDGSSSDLTFSDNFAIDDSGFAYAVALALGVETVADPTLSQEYLGIAALSESVPDPSDTFSATGIVPLTRDFTIADGGSASTAGGTQTETVAWSTSGDWDSPQSSYGVQTPSDAVELFKQFDDHNDNSIDTSKWQTGFNGANPQETNNQIYLYAGGDTVDRPFLYESPDYAPDGGLSKLIEVDITQSGDQRRVMVWFNGAVTGIYAKSEYGLGAVGENGVIRKYSPDYSGGSADISGAYFSAGDTVRVEVYGNPNDFDIELYVNGSLQASHTGETVSGYPDTDPFYGGVHGRETGGTTAFDNTTTMALDGSLTTQTKSFSEPVQPDLQNLSYSLNGESATVTVTGSPTGSSESKTVTLDGSTSYDLTWNNSHSVFEITVDVSSTSKTTPTVSKVELAGLTGGDGNSDQNVNTTWELDPALYDRSGNEYEGGGTVLRYGA